LSCGFGAGCETDARENAARAKAIVPRLKSPALIWIFLLALNLPAWAEFTIARGGKARCVIVQQPGATLAESNSVRELAGTLEKITGATFQIQEAADANVPKGLLLLGLARQHRRCFRRCRWTSWGPRSW